MDDRGGCNPVRRRAPLEDFGIILALLLMNAGVGFWKNTKRERSLRAQGHTLRYTRRQTRRNMDNNPCARAGAWRSDASVHR